MTDKKISQLTSATTPLAGTEVLPIVQSGATVKVASGDLVVFPQGFTGIKYKSANTTFNSGNVAIIVADTLGSGSGNLRIETYQGGSGGGTTIEFTGAGDVKANRGNFIPQTAGKGIDFSANTGAAGETSSLLNWYEEGTWTPANVNMTVDAGSWAATGTYTRIGRVVYFTVTQTSGTVSAAAGTDCISGFPFAPAVRGVVSFTNGAATLVGVGIVDLDSKFYNSAAITSQTALRITGWYQV